MLERVPAWQYTKTGAVVWASLRPYCTYCLFLLSFGKLLIAHSWETAVRSKVPPFVEFTISLESKMLKTSISTRIARTCVWIFVLSAESERSFDLFLCMSNQNWPKSLMGHLAIKKWSTLQVLKTQGMWLCLHKSVTIQKANRTTISEFASSFFLLSKLILTHMLSCTLVMTSYNWITLHLINAFGNMAYKF